MKRAAIFLILILTGVARAQIPGSAPSTGPATSQGAAPTTSEAAGPATSQAVTPITSEALNATAPPATTQHAGPTTVALTTAATLPTTWPGTMPAASQPLFPTTVGSSATTGPATRFASSQSYVPPQRPAWVPMSQRSAKVAIPQSPGLDLTPRPISKDYLVLLSRSIFIRGGQHVYDPGNLSDGGPRIIVTGNVSTTQSTQPTTDAVPWSPENVLVFNGASNTNGRLMAFIENTSLNSIARFQVGDGVASGKIVGITLDQLDYAVGGHVTHVMLGQNLSGVDMQVLTTQPVTATTGPAGIGSSGGADDVLERLRRRRAQELGGK